MHLTNQGYAYMLPIARGLTNYTIVSCLTSCESVRIISCGLDHGKTTLINRHYAFTRYKADIVNNSRFYQARIYILNENTLIEKID